MQTIYLPKIEVHEKSGILATFVIDLPGKPYLLGRDESCDFVVNHQEISRKHLIIQKDWSGIITFEDCGSVNGMRINGKDIKGPVEVFSKDKLQIGRLRLTLTNSPEWNENPINDTAEPTKTEFLQTKHAILLYLAALLFLLASLLLFFAV